MGRYLILVLVTAWCLAPVAHAAGPTGGASPTAPPASPQPVVPAPVQDDSVIAAKPKVIRKAQEQLTKLGFHTNGIDGIAGPFTLRAFCAFQLLTDSAGADAPATLGLLPKEDRRLLYHVKKSQLRMKMRGVRKFIRVSIRCQTLFLVERGRVKQIRPVSTGRKGVDSEGKASYATPKGKWTIYRKFGRHEGVKKNGWDRSTKYSNSPMYLSLYLKVLNRFSGFAIHGEPTPDWVAPIKASHGCIRMIKFHQYALWSRVGVGTMVWVT